MTKNNAIALGFIGLSIVVYAALHKRQAPTSAPVAKSVFVPSSMAQQRRKELAVQSQNFEAPTGAKVMAPSAKPTMKKMRIQPALLARLIPDLKKLYPGLDFSKLDPNDPRWLQLKLPKYSPLMVLHNPKCARSSVTSIGAISAPSLGETFESLPTEKFVSVHTSEELTIGDLGSKIENDSCTLGVFANGTIDNARIPMTQDLKEHLASHPVENVDVFDFKKAYIEGRELVEKSIYEGRPQALQVYMAGGNAEHFQVPENADPSQPIVGESLFGGAGQIYALPLPSTGSPSEQIADANNAVIAAIANGADVILLPAVDPEVFAAVAKLAAEHHAKVYLVPQDMPPIPSGVVDPVQPRAPASVATPNPQ